MAEALGALVVELVDNNCSIAVGNKLAVAGFVDPSMDTGTVVEVAFHMEASYPVEVGAGSRTDQDGLGG